MKAVFEPIRPHENHSFFVRDLMEPVFSAPWHYHPELELTLILNGSGLRFVGDSAEPFGKWDFVLIGSNLPHFWRILGDPPKPQSHAVVAQFKIELFDLQAFPELNNICLLLAGCARGLWFYSRTAQHLQKRFESIPHLEGAARLACLIDTLEALAFERLKGRFQTLSSEGFAPDLDTGYPDGSPNSESVRVYLHPLSFAPSSNRNRPFGKYDPMGILSFLPSQHGYGRLRIHTPRTHRSCEPPLDGDRQQDHRYCV